MSLMLLMMMEGFFFFVFFFFKELLLFFFFFFFFFVFFVFVFSRIFLFIFNYFFFFFFFNYFFSSLFLLSLTSFSFCVQNPLIDLPNVILFCNLIFSISSLSPLFPLSSPCLSRTPLCLSIRYHRPQSARFLLARKEVKVLVVDKEGNGLLHWFARHQRERGKGGGGSFSSPSFSTPFSYFGGGNKKGGEEEEEKKKNKKTRRALLPIQVFMGLIRRASDRGCSFYLRNKRGLVQICTKEMQEEGKRCLLKLVQFFFSLFFLFFTCR